MASSQITRILFPATLAAAVILSGLTWRPSTSDAAQSRSHLSERIILDSTGFYTEAQAERGQSVYKQVCAECHELQDFTNSEFRTEWEGSSLFALYENVRTTMPEENPGTLRREQYQDVVAYMLKLNSLPTGPNEFVADSASASSAILRLLPPGP